MQHARIVRKNNTIKQEMVGDLSYARRIRRAANNINIEREIIKIVSTTDFDISNIIIILYYLSSPTLPPTRGIR